MAIMNQIKRSRKSEGENPFWISYSDMMTALMVLFLIVMVASLLAVTNEISSAETAKADRDKEIGQLLTKISKSTKKFPGVVVNGNTINFGEQVRFDTDSNELTEDQCRMIRAFIPAVLDVARDPLGQKWLRRVVVEGYADKRGTYLHNLNLSIQRSERVLCVLLAKPYQDEKALSKADRRLIREIFFVGGSSFNSLRDSLEESRRVEVKLEFLDIGERRPKSPDLDIDDHQICPLDCK